MENQWLLFLVIFSVVNTAGIGLILWEIRRSTQILKTFIISSTHINFDITAQVLEKIEGRKMNYEDKRGLMLKMGEELIKNKGED